MNGTDPLEILIIGAMIGLLPAWVASRKGYSFIGWWFFGALLFIIALPVAIFLKPNRSEIDARREKNGEKRCEACFGWVPAEARICMHCGEPFGKARAV